MPDLSDLWAAAGLFLCSVGLWWIYPPLGLIVPGAVMFIMGIRLGRGGSRQKGQG